ncbi:hypothetical protein DFH06DRAFT_1127623 [Mycena polygramma]|nr:hypothetical protein DFH06DRAFT_1127623 [Mycena polygramma]
MSKTQGSPHRVSNGTLISAPPILRQSIFASTGALAALSTHFALRTLYRSTPQPALRSSTLGSAVRFWVFDLARLQCEQSGVKDPALRGALSGSLGGVVEMVLLRGMQLSRTGGQATSLIRPVAEHGALLFVAFGTYSFLASRYSPDAHPPRPLPLVFVFGAAAGAVSAGFMTLCKTANLRVATKALPMGSVRVGMTIGTQLTLHSNVKVSGTFSGSSAKLGTGFSVLRTQTGVRRPRSPDPSLSSGDGERPLRSITKSQHSARVIKTVERLVPTRNPLRMPTKPRLAGGNAKLERVGYSDKLEISLT